MKTQPRRKFVANALEMFRDLPVYVEIFVPGGFLIFVGVVSLVLVFYLLGGVSVLSSMNVASGEPPSMPRQKGYVLSGAGVPIPNRGKESFIKLSGADTEERERQESGEVAGAGRKCGCQPRNTPSRSPSRILVRVCNSKCAPLGVHWVGKGRAQCLTGLFLYPRPMRTIGIGEEEPDPFGWFYKRVPGTNVVNRTAREYAAHRIRRFFANQMTDQAFRALFESFGSRAAQMGYTSVQEFTVDLPQQRRMAILSESNIPIKWRATQTSPVSGGD
jgi:hypothetical protein